MTEYANRATKEIAISLAGRVGFAETLLSTDYRNSKKIRRSIAAMKNHAEKALSGIMDGLDQDQAKALLRAANASVLMVIPAQSPKVDREYYICPDESLDVLLSDVMSACAFCELEGKAMRRCTKRRALMDCGIVGKSDGDCPYSRA